MLLYTPAEAAVTFNVTVHEVLAAIVPPLKETELLVLVMVPPH